MARRCQITLNGSSFSADRGETLLDAALKNGIDLPYDCRSGHCGTCCVRLVSGEVHGGRGREPSIVHACQCRVMSDIVVERGQSSAIRTIEGVLSSLRPLSPDVMEVAIQTRSALPYHAGQYVKVRFSGFPSRPFSLSLPLRSAPDNRSVWFHVRRMAEGRVTSSLGTRIKPGHRVSLTGPLGSAHFRPDHSGRIICIATNTGFAPIWSIATAALRENPYRSMMVIAGGRTIQALYMGVALAQLASFPNVRVVPVCSTPQTLTSSVLLGRPTDVLPRIFPTDILYACGAEGMVERITSIAAQSGAVCYADPFLPSVDDTVEDSRLGRVFDWLSVPTVGQLRHKMLRRKRTLPRRQMRTLGMAEQR